MQRPRTTAPPPTEEGDAGDFQKSRLFSLDVYRGFVMIVLAAYLCYRPTDGGPLEPPRPGAPAGRGLPSRRRWAMGVLRALAFVLLLLVLLQPVARFRRTLGVKPRLAVLLDDSQSMTITDRRTRPEERLGAARALGLAKYGGGEGLSASAAEP